MYQPQLGTAERKETQLLALVNTGSMDAKGISGAALMDTASNQNQ